MGVRIKYFGEVYGLEAKYKQDGELVFVLDTDQLYGPSGNLLLAWMVDEVIFEDGRVLMPPTGLEQS